MLVARESAVNHKVVPRHVLGVLASSEARYTAALAMSTTSQVAPLSPSPLMMAATCASSAAPPSIAENCSTTIGVGTAYGEMQLTRTPWRESSAAAALTIPAMANLETESEYGYVPSPPTMPLMLAMQRIEPSAGGNARGRRSQHDAHGVLDPRQRPAHVHGHDGVELHEVQACDLRRAGGQRAHDAGAVEHDVQPAVPRHGGVHGRSDAVLDGDVAGHEG